MNETIEIKNPTKDLATQKKELLESINKKLKGISIYDQDISIKLSDIFNCQAEDLDLKVLEVQNNIRDGQLSSQLDVFDKKIKVVVLADGSIVAM